jgi:hypothetical protein
MSEITIPRWLVMRVGELTVENAGLREEVQALTAEVQRLTPPEET